jgi:DNA-binding NarL/FixJ family response regulator
MMTYQIYIIDDHPVFREGLAYSLSKVADFKIVGEAGSSDEVLSQHAQLTPDIYIVDISLRGMNGLELIKHLRQLKPQQKFLALSMYEESLYAQRAIQAGAIGYLHKSLSADKLSEGIRWACEGKYVVSDHQSVQVVNPESLDKMTGRLNKKEESAETTKEGFDASANSAIQGNIDDFDILSDRELEIFTYIGQGKRPSEIATLLHISTKTVDTHLHNMKKKLKLAHMNELICYAAIWVHRSLS